ncbi:MAG: hypothetical protein ACLFP8_06985 [Alphaproteobacteria bacterium]
MIFYLRFFCMIAALGCLSGCGAVGTVLGEITVLPIRAVRTVASAATYQDSSHSALDSSVDHMSDASPLHQTDN